MRYFLMRWVRPALYLPVELSRWFPGDPRQGLKLKIFALIVSLDKPLLVLNRRWHAQESKR
jgi:hypothetical protein